MKYRLLNSWTYSTDEFLDFIEEWNLQVELHNEFGVTKNEFEGSDLDANEIFPVLIDLAEKYLTDSGYAYVSNINEDGTDIVCSIFQLTDYQLTKEARE